ncbi:hypothetical protein F2Q70_00008573 [Brassica cretica]|uniref:STAR protein homodimerisation region domain-containing protein n=1 Tax=Brassica cretica TaxID=69181 RepID=A0A8S9M0Q9_BRACR|nr:hypothetical protein F2Q70_00008573 [Brassica cretica]
MSGLYNNNSSYFSSPARAASPQIRSTPPEIDSSQYLTELLAEHQKLTPFTQVLPICSRLLNQGFSFYLTLFLIFNSNFLICFFSDVRAPLLTVTVKQHVILTFSLQMIQENNKAMIRAGVIFHQPHVECDLSVLKCSSFSSNSAWLVAQFPLDQFEIVPVQIPEVGLNTYVSIGTFLYPKALKSPQFVFLTNLFMYVD